MVLFFTLYAASLFSAALFFLTFSSPLKPSARGPEMDGRVDFHYHGGRVCTTSTTTHTSASAGAEPGEAERPKTRLGKWKSTETPNSAKQDQHEEQADHCVRR
ncbi:hypothetical protein B0T25DRAFT_555260 [Lasiosphaeria hispida]|uniref:Secreted protein n=1 Tax=Lasiosphaeria hispida TaxID=260671 RepID=A0AAJ0H8M5_9PEZI|nr:hypothetical protein B0T25DRAFT_555260 [Lasiosphaeria hispida]